MLSTAFAPFLRISFANSLTALREAIYLCEGGTALRSTDGSAGWVFDVYVVLAPTTARERGSVDRRDRDEDGLGLIPRR